jgi:hypothetical protein
MSNPRPPRPDPLLNGLPDPRLLTFRWHPKLIYRGRGVRVQMRAILGNVRLGEVKPGAIIHRIFALKRSRDEMLQRLRRSDIQYFKDHLGIDGVSGKLHAESYLGEKRYVRAFNCLPRFAPFKPKKMRCGMPWLCPFCYAMRVSHKWNRTNAAVFNAVVGPGYWEDLIHELPNRSLIYRRQQPVELDLHEQHGPRSFFEWIRRRTDERTEQYETWERSRRIKGMIEMIYVGQPDPNGLIRPEIRQMILLPLNQRFPESRHCEMTRTYAPTRVQIARTLGDMATYPRWLLKADPWVIYHFLVSRMRVPLFNTRGEFLWEREDDDAGE